MSHTISNASSKFKASTLFNETEITGYCPIYLSHSALFLEIYNPSKSVLSVPISKKLCSILILSDFPNLLGLVKRLATPPRLTSVSINPVLST